LDILKVHNVAASDFIGEKSRLEVAKRLGLAKGRTLLVENDTEWALMMDFALHATKQGRSRAIDRYAQVAQPANEDSALVLQAMCSSIFSVWHIERRHEVAGLILADMLHEGEVWLMNEALEKSAENGLIFAARLCLIDGFAMSTGVIVPLTEDILEEVLDDALCWPSTDSGPPIESARFAMSVCKTAVDRFMLDRVVFR
jgi:hypothetical protein